jgi:hypothetical protein
MFKLYCRSALTKLSFACSTLSAFALLLPTLASASGIQVTYNVTGGTFGGASLSGPILGGSMTYIVPTASTNLATFSATGPVKLVSLVLLGGSGSFSLLSPISFPASANHTANSAQLIGSFASAPVHSGAFSGAQHLFLDQKYPNPLPGFGLGVARSLGGLERTGTHVFLTGQEVRSLVVMPEPGTGLLLGLGLGGLAVAGRRARTILRPGGLGLRESDAVVGYCR